MRRRLAIAFRPWPPGTPPAAGRSLSMTTYVAFLRAINVAGHAIVKMEDLRKAFAAGGCRTVRTYIQSGNVVFECGETQADAIVRKTQTRARTLFGEAPTILIRTVDDL